MFSRTINFSLRRQIVLSLSITAAATIVLACGWFYWQFETATGSLRNSTLVSRAEMITNHLVTTSDGTITLDLPPVLVKAFTGHGGRHRYSVRDENGRILFGTAGAPTGEPPAQLAVSESGKFYHYHDPGVDSGKMVGVAQLIDIGNQRIILQVEEASRDQMVLARALLEVIIENSAWAMLPLLLVPLGVSLFIIRRSLGPVIALSAKAAAIGPASTDIRLPEHGVPIEILPLVQAINQALKRLDDGFRMQREFTAGAAHELRTPLAVLTAHVGTLLDQETAATLRKDIEVMTHLTGQLLKVAQLESLAIGENERADLNLVAAEVVGNLAPLAVRNGKDIELVEADGLAMVWGSSEAICHAVQNLAHNAITHTVPGSIVTVSVGSADDGLVITVSDHGPGVPIPLRERIFDQFWRADRRTSGAGLGLAIVRAVMTTHGGQVSISEASGGGALFTLWFPRTCPIPQKFVHHGFCKLGAP